MRTTTACSRIAASLPMAPRRRRRPSPLQTGGSHRFSGSLKVHRHWCPTRPPALHRPTTGVLKARGAPDKPLALPTGGHSTRNIVFNRAGTKLYIAVGSESNSDAGEDCRRAAILEVNPDGTGSRIFASGIRNPVGLTLQPGTDVVWTATNERDNLGDDLVPNYVTSVKDGAFYGWPYSYIG